jgi:hypothetical protein
MEILYFVGYCISKRGSKKHIIGITKNKTLDYIHCMDTISLSLNVHLAWFQLITESTKFGTNIDYMFKQRNWDGKLNFVLMNKICTFSDYKRKEACL